MDNIGRKMSGKIGMPPGTLIHVGQKLSEEVKISVIDYDEHSFNQIECDKAAECVEFKQKDSVSWINVDGLHQVDVIERIGKVFNLHPLLLEDILNTTQRPKVEDFGDYVFFTLKMLGFDENHQIVSEQVSIVLGKNYVITFQEKEGDVFDPLRDRISTGKGTVRSRKADYLMYRFIDMVVDNYFIISEYIGEIVDQLEEEIMDDPDEDTIKTIQQLKRQLIFLRRSIMPLREAIGSLDRGATHLIAETTSAYLNDVHDHTIQFVETVETYRDILSGLTDIYLTNLSNRMNGVMKVLTIIATIFIPLTFVAGIYGMNFEYMPELKYKWAYPAVWGVMILTTIGMLIFFRRKKWL